MSFVGKEEQVRDYFATRQALLEDMVAALSRAVAEVFQGGGVPLSAASSRRDIKVDGVESLGHSRADESPQKGSISTLGNHLEDEHKVPFRGSKWADPITPVDSHSKSFKDTTPQEHKGELLPQSDPKEEGVSKANIFMKPKETEKSDEFEEKAIEETLSEPNVERVSEATVRNVQKLIPNSDENTTSPESDIRSPLSVQVSKIVELVPSESKTSDFGADQLEFKVMTTAKESEENNDWNNVPLPKKEVTVPNCLEKADPIEKPKINVEVKSTVVKNFFEDNSNTNEVNESNSGGFEFFQQTGFKKKQSKAVVDSKPFAGFFLKEEDNTEEFSDQDFFGNAKKLLLNSDVSGDVFADYDQTVKNDIPNNDEFWPEIPEEKQEETVKEDKGNGFDFRPNIEEKHHEHQDISKVSSSILL